MDLAPTFLALAGAQYPQDGSAQPMRGASLLPLLRGETDTVHGDDYVTVLALSGRALVRKGPWKLTALEPPFDEDHFALYNIADDPGETTDLRSSQPEKYAELIGIWRTERKALGIVLPEDL
jgi:arylsulfatase